MWCWPSSKSSASNEPIGPEDVEPGYLSKSVKKWLVTSQPVDENLNVMGCVVSELVAVQKTLAEQNRKLAALTVQIVDLKTALNDKDKHLRDAEVRIYQLERRQRNITNSVGSEINCRSPPKSPADAKDPTEVNNSGKHEYKKKPRNSYNDNMSTTASGDQLQLEACCRAGHVKKSAKQDGGRRSGSSRERKRLRNKTDSSDLASSGYFGSSQESGFSSRRPSLPATLDQMLGTAYSMTSSSSSDNSCQSLDEENKTGGSGGNKRSGLDSRRASCGGEPRLTSSGHATPCVRRNDAVSSPSVMASPAGSTTSEVITGRFRVSSVS